MEEEADQIITQTLEEVTDTLMADLLLLDQISTALEIVRDQKTAQQDQQHLEQTLLHQETTIIQHQEQIHLLREATIIQHLEVIITHHLEVLEEALAEVQEEAVVALEEVLEEVEVNLKL